MTAGTPADRAAWPRARVKFFIATALLACVGATFPGIAALPTDTDSDGIPDTADNCMMAFNPGQLDADQDGNGNICDADLDNSGLVSSADYVIMQSVLNKAAESSATAAAADLDGSGTVNSIDLLRLRIMIGSSPGPSGLASGVEQSTSGFALVSWLPPTRRTDGSVLTNLAGYQIRFGTRPGALDQTISLNNPGLSSYLVQGLTPGFWYFAVVAVDSKGIISSTSAIKYKQVS